MFTQCCTLALRVLIVFSDQNYFHNLKPISDEQKNIRNTKVATKVLTFPTPSVGPLVHAL